MISHASGSAYAEFGATRVMVGVYGPRQSERRGAGYKDEGTIDCDVRLASFATRRRGKPTQVRHYGVCVFVWVRMCVCVWGGGGDSSWDA